MTEDSLESLRRSYRPGRVHLLLVGESPPAGPTFFYRANSGLYRATREAFQRAYDRDWACGAQFLEFFMSRGCYLDDLYLQPVNRLPSSQRQASRTLGVPSLAARIRDYAPLAIASVMRAIHGSVIEAASRAYGKPTSVTSLPFPRQRHTPRYVDELETLLLRLIDDGLLL